MKKRVAVVDIGSNSIKILVAEGPGVTPVFEKTLETRLSPAAGEPADRLSESAIFAGVAAVAALLPHADVAGAEKIAVVATSMVREAKNGAEFADALFDGTGERLRILTGAEEAAGIAAGIATDPDLAAKKHLGVFDLGGGSMEFIHRVDGVVRTAISRRAGAVHMTRRHIADPASPIPEKQLAALRAEVREMFAGEIAAALKAGPLTAAGCGGAFTALRLMRAAENGLSPKETDAFADVATLGRLMRDLAAMPLVERVAVPGLPVARADILPAAFAILLEIASLAKVAGFTHSWRNLRYGVAAGLLAEIAQKG